LANIDQKYFPALDGLRAVCIAMVIFTHVRKGPGDILAGFPGWLGVDIFFVISGFLITTLSLREEATNLAARIDLFAFYIRRFFRIIPPYALILAIYIAKAATNHLEWQQMTHVLPYYLTFMNDLVLTRGDAGIDFIGSNRGHFLQSWSLGIEEKFYIVWPLLFFVILRSQRKLRWLVIPVLCGAVSFLPFRMFRSYIGLLLGCCLAIALASGLLPQIKRIFRLIPATGIIFLMALGLYLVTLSDKFVFLFSAFSVVFVASITVTDNWLARMLSHRYFVWVGKRSYSMYLVQMFAVGAVQKVIAPTSTLRQVAVTVFSIAGSLAMAQVMYRLVEEPSRIFGKHFLAKRGRTSSSITPSVHAT